LALRLLVLPPPSDTSRIGWRRWSRTCEPPLSGATAKSSRDNRVTTFRLRSRRPGIPANTRHQCGSIPGSASWYLRRQVVRPWDVSTQRWELDLHPRPKREKRQDSKRQRQPTTQPHASYGILHGFADDVLIWTTAKGATKSLLYLERH